jgi:hypothetical protein
MSDQERMRFELSEEETRTYYDWVSKLAAQCQGQDEAGLDAVVISFVLTPMGTAIVAHLGKTWEEGEPHIILRDLF